MVIPTCNRKSRVLDLLNNLDQSTYPIFEVIVVDSGDDQLYAADYHRFKNLGVECVRSERSVCLQRNRGIAIAKSPWIFVCDDDIEVPPDYLAKIVSHIGQHPDAVAVSGLVLQLEKKSWVAEYPVRSVTDLLWRYTFQLSIWGEIQCRDNLISRPIKEYYRRRGNHISRAGWPVITNFQDEYFETPIYGLGASVIMKEWLVKFPYPEMLDSHGIGDNYGLAINFPENSLHVLNNAFVYHHQETQNRLDRPLQYFRRVMALDFFRRTNERLRQVKKRMLVWSLAGNLFSFVVRGEIKMIGAAFKTLYRVTVNENPYLKKMRREKHLPKPSLENL